MSREINKLLNDILKAIDLIEVYLREVPTLALYKQNFMLIDAVERRLSIIGEALWKANKIESSINVTNKTKIISLRHIIVHDYDLVEDEAIWLICQKHLPVLKQEVQLFLNND